MDTEKDQQRFVQFILLEVERLRGRIEIQSRYTDVLEGKLADSVQATKTSETVRVSDEISPKAGGARLPYTSKSLNGAFRPMRNRQGDELAAADDSWWPRLERSKQPLLPTPGWRNYRIRGEVTKVVGVSVCGMSRTLLQHAVDSIAAQQDRLRDFIPLFLTDSLEFDVFRRHGFVFEYFPPAEERSLYRGTISWAEYASNRIELLKRKWGLSHIVCIGPIEFGKVAEGSHDENATLAAAADNHVASLFEPQSQRKESPVSPAQNYTAKFESNKRRKTRRRAARKTELAN